ncbi:uncharacterized protein JCM15063_002555 [Sporobolomyces koalae]|uniref:uncharacterized protein n=1 Tax=Sporobolomyces koalae TaxID=500713 RepID=UPI003170FB9E
MLPSQQLEQRRQRLARLQPERDEPQQLDHVSSSPSPSPVAQLEVPPAHTSPSTEPDALCWICYESKYDTPDKPIIHACSCTLLAHPDCLLHWIATRANPTQPPRCPVCKTLIIVTQDRSEFLRVYRTLRRSWDRLSIAATVAGLAAGGWLVASAYGLWALRVFMGNRVAHALLNRNRTGFPFRLWLNLPLIPFALILSRTPVIDSLLPFLPLTLALSTHRSPATTFSALSTTLDPLGLDDLTLRFPPSPTLTICLIPWLRIVYFRYRARLFKRVLGQQKRYFGLAGMMEEAARDEQATWEVLDEGRSGPGDQVEPGREGNRGRRNGLELVAELEFEVEEIETGSEPEREDDNVEPAQRRRRHRHHVDHPLDAQGVEPEAHPDEDRPPPPSSLRIGIGRLTSLLVGALVYPALASLAGSVLYYLATRGGRASLRNPSLPIRTLRKILGISSLIAASARAPSTPASPLAFLNPFQSSGNGVGGIVDPVWIRNTIGGGIVLLVRDAFELSAGILEKRRKESRKIVERPVGENLSLNS